VALKSDLVGVKLPDLEPGQSEQVTYQVPVLGKTESNISTSEIRLYSYNQEEDRFRDVGRSSGSIEIDLSAMDQAWYFNPKAAVITDYPNLSDDEVALYFYFDLRNLTLEDVDQVAIEFLVPEQITVHEPDYTYGTLDITWEGNKATVKFDDLRGGDGYQAYFTAIGTSSLPMDQII